MDIKVSPDKKRTIITASIDKYLVIKNTDNSEQLIGKPIKIMFDNSAEIPEFEERDI